MLVENRFRSKRTVLTALNIGKSQYYSYGFFKRIKTYLEICF